MFTDWSKIPLPQTTPAERSGKPEPIRPKGVSSRLPLLALMILLAVLFIGYRSVIESQAWRSVEAFFRQNQEVRAAVGEVRACRPWYPLKVDFTGEALLIQVAVRIEGTKGERKGHILLKYEGGDWAVVAAALDDGQGRARPLARRGKPVDPGTAPSSVPPVTPAPESAPAIPPAKP
jgi:hypothetical protein